jgi:hypothetical protein
MEQDPTQDRTRGAPEGDVPNEEAAEREFPRVANRSLAEQTDLVDDDGDDIRQYTGEPVPTEHGAVAPQQMATGAQRTVGGGEWPEAPPRGEDDHDPEDRDAT